MSDPSIVLVRVFSLLFVPIMLLAPLVFALCIRNRSDGGEAVRAEIRLRTIALALCTVLALAVWAAFLVAGTATGSEVLSKVSQFCWPLFFPLWFGFAMPVIRAKNPAWGNPNSGVVRTASLVSRERRSPVRAWHWALTAIACLVLLGAVVSRGWAGEPFPSDYERHRWIVLVASYGASLLILAVTLPWSLRLALREPEPLDAQGSPELQRMYDEFRDARIRWMFWLMGFILPVLLGASLALVAWLASPLVGGMLGAIGGTTVGIIGAWLGTAMSVRRARIAEFKASLDRGSISAPPVA